MPSTNPYGPVRTTGRGHAALRDALVVLGVFLVLGVLGGWLWWLLVTPAEFTKLAAGGAMGENELGKQFGADGWYAVIGFVAGGLAGLGLTGWRTRDPLLTSLLVVVGAAVAAVAMLLVGQWLGPGDAQQALRTAPVGTRVPEPLDVDSFTIYLGWPAGALVGALFVLVGRTPQADPVTE